jgi:hypothetical protein
MSTKDDDAELPIAFVFGVKGETGKTNGENE